MSGVIRWVFVCMFGVCVGTECLVLSDGSLYVCVGCVGTECLVLSDGSLYVCVGCVGTECLESSDGSLYVCVGGVLELNVWCYQMVFVCMCGVCWN